MSNKKLPDIPPSELPWLAGMLQAESNFTMDDRKRSTGNDPSYTPPPPSPIIVIEMVEEDVLERIGQLVDEKVVLQKRRTSAGKKVYRVTIQARAKVEQLMRLILPHTVGQERRQRLEKLIAICDEYNQWVADGGPSKQAAAAARAGHAKRRAAKEAQKAKEAQEQKKKQ